MSLCPIPGPCSYCGSPDHWRPDCPEIAAEVAAESPEDRRQRIEIEKAEMKYDVDKEGA